MAAVNVVDLAVGEKAFHGLEGILAGVLGPQPADKQRGPVIPALVSTKREVGHVIEGRAQNVQGHAEMVVAMVLLFQVGQ